mmetsp:Transcript_64313/g.176499  ORF Transcript_64313/g.176499 Transcript_64313/m.176499 type:complete len:236 (-) Transcript_64313:618-1325(-)
MRVTGPRRWRNSTSRTSRTAALPRSELASAGTNTRALARPTRSTSRSSPASRRLWDGAPRRGSSAPSTSITTIGSAPRSLQTTQLLRPRSSASRPSGSRSPHALPTRHSSSSSSRSTTSRTSTPSRSMGIWPTSESMRSTPLACAQSERTAHGGSAWSEAAGGQPLKRCLAPRGYAGSLFRTMPTSSRSSTGTRPTLSAGIRARTSGQRRTTSKRSTIRWRPWARGARSTACLSG